MLLIPIGKIRDLGNVKERVFRIRALAVAVEISDTFNFRRCVVNRRFTLTHLLRGTEIFDILEVWCAREILNS